MRSVAIYPLRLPRSLKAGIERVSKRDGTSVNQFVAMAAAEKLATLEAEDFFRSRIKQADLATFDRIMARTGGQPPREGDER
jgi:UDP-N-acetyl-D-mannosaminuronic acid transferase (WecB/TagA/CpsF family)